MRSGEEIQTALKQFVGRWSGYTGSERAEAQTFLNELFAAYGSDRHDVDARFEDFQASAGFMDLHWPEVCIVEMKAPGKPLEAAREQVTRYWEESADDAADRPAAQWVVICNFHSFEVPFATGVRTESGIPSAAVGLITEPRQADAIVAEGRADAVLLARQALREPRWWQRAAAELGRPVPYPDQYARAR